MEFGATSEGKRFSSNNYECIKRRKFIVFSPHIEKDAERFIKYLNQQGHMILTMYHISKPFSLQDICSKGFDMKTNNIQIEYIRKNDIPKGAK